jgi:hypothetical protein
VPDVVLRTAEASVVLDAKYKPHAELIARHGWDGVAEVVRERHRADVHQVLAYAALEDRPSVRACLVYPASPEGWDGLVARGRETMRATVRSQERHREQRPAPVQTGQGPRREPERPALVSVVTPESTALSWDPLYTASGFRLERTESLTPPVAWEPVEIPAGATNVVIPSSASASGLYRLVRP